MMPGSKLLNRGNVTLPNLFVSGIPPSSGVREYQTASWRVQSPRRSVMIRILCRQMLRQGSRSHSKPHMGKLPNRETDGQAKKDNRGVARKGRTMDSSSSSECENTVHTTLVMTSMRILLDTIVCRRSRLSEVLDTRSSAPNRKHSKRRDSRNDLTSSWRPPPRCRHESAHD